MNIETIKSHLIEIGIGVVIFITAVVHLSLGAPHFILNGLGYLLLGAALLLPISPLVQWRERIRWLLVAYALITIVLYFIAHPNGSWQQDGLGIATKFIEFLLILLLIYDWQEKTTVTTPE